MERPALFVGDAEEGSATLNEDEVRERMRQGVPPESAEEYLLRVRIESSELPAVVEAHVPEVLKKKQTMYMPSTEPVPACPAFLLPSDEWEREVVSTFVDLRQYLRRWKATGGVSVEERQPVPALKDGTGWHIFCLGYTEDEEDEEVVESEVGSFNGSMPLGLPSSEHHHQQQQQQQSLSTAAASARAALDPRNDDDAQSSFCIAPVETSSRFDKFTATLARTSEAAPQEEQESESGAAGAEGDEDKNKTKPVSAAATAANSEADFGATVSSPSSPSGTGGGAGGPEGGRGGEGEGGPVEAGKRATGKDWLQTHPHGTPPTMRLAMQFDQVLTQRVLAFHADWLRDNLLSRARAVWIYTLLACLEKPLGSETAALVREVLRRCCAQRAEVESPLDDNLPALNVIVAIAGRFFQQAEVA
eukprot:g16369.t1